MSLVPISMETGQRLPSRLQARPTGKPRQGWSQYKKVCPICKEIVWADRDGDDLMWACSGHWLTFAKFVSLEDRFAFIGSDAA